MLKSKNHRPRVPESLLQPRNPGCECLAVSRGQEDTDGVRALAAVFSAPPSPSAVVSVERQDSWDKTGIENLCVCQLVPSLFKGHARKATLRDQGMPWATWPSSPRSSRPGGEAASGPPASPAPVLRMEGWGSGDQGREREGKSGRRRSRKFRRQGPQRQRRAGRPGGEPGRVAES